MKNLEGIDEVDGLGGFDCVQVTDQGDFICANAGDNALKDGSSF